MGKLIQYNEQRGIMFFREEDSEEHKHLGVYDGTIVVENEESVSVIPLIDRDEINYMLSLDSSKLCHIEKERLILRNEEISDVKIIQTIEHHIKDVLELDIIKGDIIGILQVSGIISNDIRVVCVIERLIEEYVKLKYPDYDE